MTWDDVCEARVRGPLPITFTYLGVSHGHAEPHVTVRARMETVDALDASKRFPIEVDYQVRDVDSVRGKLRALHQLALRMYQHELGEQFTRGMDRPFAPRHGGQ